MLTEAQSSITLHTLEGKNTYSNAAHAIW